MIDRKDKTPKQMEVQPPSEKYNPLARELENLYPSLDISIEGIAKSVARIKKALEKYDLEHETPQPNSGVLLIGGGSGTPIVGSSLIMTGLENFTMLANTGEVGRNKDTRELMGGGIIFEGIPDSVDWIDIVKQSVHTMPEERRNSVHKLLDTRREPSMRLGYLTYEALRQSLGSPQQAADFGNYWMGNPYRVIPSTQERAELFFQVKGQELGLFDYALREKTEKIAERFYLKPKVKLSEYAQEAITKANNIVIGPGDVFFSVLPHWSIDGFKDAISANSKARIILITNLTARPMDIPNFKLSDVLELFGKYLPDREIVALVNNGEISETNPLIDDITNDRFDKYLIVRKPISSRELSGNKQLIHDKQELGKTLRELM